ncbi:MAG: hypothetical protein JO212_01010 [Acetobacteraceae bacterium]|nr:hypothetical protein [Acetobacteraceae bacterium]
MPVTNRGSHEATSVTCIANNYGFGELRRFATQYRGLFWRITVSNAASSTWYPRIGRILLENGYRTSWFGEDHNTPDWVATQAGPFDQWPTGKGFEYFYGFVCGRL